MTLSRTLIATALVTVGLVLPTTTAVPARAAAANERAAAKPYVVKASAHRSSVAQGGRLFIRGTVRGGDRGDRVQLQVKYTGSGWKRTDLSARIGARGAFRITDRVSSSRSRAYRVVKTGDRDHRAGRSKAFRVTVYSWRDLGSYDAVNQHNIDRFAQVKINGTQFPSSLEASHRESQGGISFNLERKCRQLKTTAGIADTSADTATGAVSLKADGVQTFAQSYTLTRSTPIVLKVSGVFRFTFDWSSTNTAGTPEDQSGAHVALGSPQVLCRD